MKMLEVASPYPWEVGCRVSCDHMGRLPGQRGHGRERSGRPGPTYWWKRSGRRPRMACKPKYSPSARSCCSRCGGCRGTSTPFSARMRLGTGPKSGSAISDRAGKPQKNVERNLWTEFENKHWDFGVLCYFYSSDDPENTPSTPEADREVVTFH